MTTVATTYSRNVDTSLATVPTNPTVLFGGPLPCGRGIVYIYNAITADPDNVIGTITMNIWGANNAFIINTTGFSNDLSGNSLPGSLYFLGSLGLPQGEYLAFDFTNHILTVAAYDEQLTNWTFKLILEATDSSGNITLGASTLVSSSSTGSICVSAPLYSTGPITCDSALYLGTGSSSNPIYIGSNGSKSITIGNASSTTNVNGPVTMSNDALTTTTLTPATGGTITYDEFSGTLKRFGAMAYLSFTGVISPNGVVSVGTTYDLCNFATGSGFSPSSQGLGMTVIQGQVTPGTVTIDRNETKFGISLPVVIVSSKTIKGTLSYFV